MTFAVDAEGKMERQQRIVPAAGDDAHRSNSSCDVEYFGISNTLCFILLAG